jgi:hypothetical protein
LNEDIMSPKPGDATPTPSAYSLACQTLAEIVAGAVQKSKAVPLPAPAPRATVVLEEAFALLQTSIFGSGLDEEAITAAFMSALAGAARMWSACWVWDGQPPGDLCWIHYNKKSESLIGADFALLLATPGVPDGAAAGYRLIVVQAKLQHKSDVGRLSVEQSADWGKKIDANTRNDVAEFAEQSLQKLLDEVAGYSIDVKQEPHFQLSKLIELRNRFKRLVDEKRIAQMPDILYSIWPDSRAEPYYCTLQQAILDVVKTNLGNPAPAPGKQSAKITQSIDINTGALLREWLLTTASVGGAGTMTLKQATTALAAVDQFCSATLILDLSNNGLGNTLTTALKLQKPAPLPAVARQTAAKTNAPKN